MSIDPQEAHPWISVMYDVGVAIDDYFTTADFATSEAEDIQTTRVFPGDVNNTIGESMDIDVLKTELLAGHPGTGAYDADDAVAALQTELGLVRVGHVKQARL